jgi:ATP-dependent Clp protease ATP-binding subunit ClpC
MSIGPLGPGGPGDWDDLLARFFGAAEPRRSAQRIDIMRYLSADAREVLSVAARRAAETPCSPSWVARPGRRARSRPTGSH